MGRLRAGRGELDFGAARRSGWAAKHLFEFEVENDPCTSSASAPERSIPEHRLKGVPCFK